MHRQLPGTDYGVREIIENAFWQEAALYGDEDDTLVVPAASRRRTTSSPATNDSVSTRCCACSRRDAHAVDPERVLVGTETV